MNNIINLELTTVLYAANAHVLYHEQQKLVVIKFQQIDGRKTFVIVNALGKYSPKINFLYQYMG